MRELRETKEAEERRAEERRAAEEREALEQVRARIEAVERRRLEDMQAAEAARVAIAAAKEEKTRIRKAEREAEQEVLERTRLAREREEARLEELEEKKRKAKERLAKKKERPDWPPEALVGLGNASSLKRLGFLPPDWNNDAQALLRAKKAFVGLFAKPKRGAAPTEADKPTKDFGQVFPSRQDFESPDAETHARLRGFMETK
jgi:hypothetical protein